MDTEGIDPNLVQEIRKRLSTPGEMEGVDPALVSQLKDRFGLYEAKNDEAAWAADNPAAGLLEETAKLPIVKKTGEVFSAVTEAGGSALEKLAKYDPIAKKTGEVVFGAGQKIRDYGAKAEEVADRLLVSGQYGRTGPQLMRGAGILLQNSPLPANYAEVVGMALLEGAGTLKGPIAAKTQAIAKSLPGVKPFVDMDRMPESFRAGLAERAAKQADLIQTERNIKVALEKHSLNNTPKLDQVAFGNNVKGLLDNVTLKSATPLKAASRLVQDLSDNIGKGSVEHLSGSFKKIGDDLLGQISIPPDSPVLSILKKYQGTVVEKAKNNIFGKFTEYPEVSVGDLLKDRGRLGKEYSRLLGEGGKGTPQSTAILKLQRVIDGEINSRLATNPQLKKLVDVTREGWRNHYEIFWSDEAVSLRKADASKIISKISNSPEMLDGIRQLMPEVIEEIRLTSKSDLIRKLGTSGDPATTLKNTLAEKKALYDRILTPQDAIELNQIAELNRRLPEATKRVVELAKELEDAKITSRRAGDKTRLVDRRKKESEGPTNILGSLRALQGTRLAVPVEATTLAYGLHWLSPTASKVILAAGVTPAAAAWAYYSIPKSARSKLSAVFKRVAEKGTMKSPAADLQLLRRVERFEPLDKNGDPVGNALDKLGALLPKKAQEQVLLPSDINPQEGASIPEASEEPLTYEEAKVRGLTD